MSVRDRDWAHGDPPPEVPPMSMAESAVALHEVYSSYVAAGFTPDQAMVLLVATLNGAIK